MTEKKETPKTDADISPEERSLIDDSMENSSTRDNINLKRSVVDQRDEDGELLNENLSGDLVSGEELDVPGSEADDANEAIGEEDEENNSYSLPDQ